MQIQIRSATTADIPWLISELHAFAAFFGTKRSLLEDESAAAGGLQTMMDQGYFRIAEVKGVGPVGFIAGTLFPHPFNQKITVLNETFWWVDPLYRHSRAGFMLFQDFKKYGEEHADWVSFALETNTPVSDEFMTRNGFRLQERSFLMEV